jgi:hypothetical protein
MIRGKQRLGKIDVFCGRGKGFDEFPGYQFFRNLIHGYSTSYSSARTSRAERSQLIRTILTQLKTRTIRFIKRSDVNNWVVLEEKEINIKVRIDQSWVLMEPCCRITLNSRLRLLLLRLGMRYVM